jgi:hypothetical protein
VKRVEACQSNDRREMKEMWNSVRGQSARMKLILRKMRNVGGPTAEQHFGDGERCNALVLLMPEIWLVGLPPLLKLVPEDFACE